MKKTFIRAHHFLVSFPKQGPRIKWKKAMSVIIIAGAMIGGLSGTAHAMTSTIGQGLYENISLTVPRLEQPEQVGVNNEYLFTHIERDRSAGPQSMIASTTTAAATRCPAFVSWEDWGGARVHAYVDFRPSDLCNGRHIKVAYVRLIRQCGPYYDSGRIYTYSATSASDTRLFSVSAWILDSPLWWCNTNTYYGYDYF